MLGCTRNCLALLLLLLPHAAALAQRMPWDEPPRILKDKRPPTRQEVERRDSLKLYVYGLLCLRDDRLLEALKSFDEAARLDPDAAGVHKARVPLLLALERGADALAASLKVVELDPEDYESWFIAARLHKAMGKYADARVALDKGLATERVKDHPELAQQMYLDLGSLHEVDEKYTQAAEAFTKAAAILEHPDALLDKGEFDRNLILMRASETYEKIGNLYRKGKKHHEATAAYKKAQERFPDRAGRLNFNLAQLCEEQGQLPAAVAYTDAYLRLQPSGLEAYELKISLLQKLNKNDAILPWLEQAAKNDQFNAGLQTLLGKEYVRAKLYGKAEQRFKSLAAESPTAEVYRELFKAQRLAHADGMDQILNSLNGVLAKVNQRDGPFVPQTQARLMVGALSGDPDLAKKLVEVAFQRVTGGDDKLAFETVHFLAVLADRHRRSDESEAFYRRCLPNVVPANEAIVYGGLLRVLSKARKYDDVVKLCREGLLKARATNQLLFHNDLARALAGLYRFDDALAAAEKAIDLAGDDNKLMLRMLRVRILTMSERFAAAEKAALELLEKHKGPGDELEIRYLLANVYSAAKQMPKAEEQLQLVLKADPNNPTANNDLGYHWAEQGKQLELAESMIRKALDGDRQQRKKSTSLLAEEDKDNASYVDSLGWVLFRRGKIDEARKELERASAMPDGDDPVIFDHLGDVYYRLQLRPEAQRSWQRAVQLYDQGARTKDNDRTRDLQRKLQLVREEIGAAPGN